MSQKNKIYQSPVSIFRGALMMMTIEPVSKELLHSVAQLEKAIEGKRAASIETLKARQAMYPEGFLIAREGEEIRGYVESCLWNRTEQEFEREVDSFPKYHNPQAESLYVIWLGVDPAMRRKGIGSQLMQGLQLLAKTQQLQKIHLAARDELIPFYQSLGFKIIRPLPNFLPDTTYTQMAWCVVRSPIF